MHKCPASQPAMDKNAYVAEPYSSKMTEKAERLLLFENKNGMSMKTSVGFGSYEARWFAFILLSDICIDKTGEGIILIDAANLRV